MNYTIKIEQLKPNNEEETNQIESKYIAIEVNEGQKEILGDYTKGRSTYEGEEYESIEAREIVKGTLKGEESRNYAIKLWMDENVTLEDNVVNKKFIGKVVVDGNLNELAEYNEPILHGTNPVLKEELVPVVIDDKGNVTKANTKEEWYNYEEKRWANAIILANGSSEDYKEGEQIPEEDIESYFVWIPRYNYKLFDMGEYTSVTDAITNKGPTTAIQIKFGTSDTTDTKKECATPKMSGESGDCAVGKWMTHPAFLAFDATGFWVGKFETSNSLITSLSMATTHNNDTEASQILIKPNEYSWRGIELSNAYKTSLAYKTELQSHLMKNTEWGAVAYLTQSIYGKCTDKNNCEEVYINNNSNYITGFSGATASQSKVQVAISSDSVNNSYNYKNPLSVKASTTGNYTGIYDMSGGAWEQMASFMSDSDNSTLNYSSIGLNKEDLKEEKYYDVYNYNTSETNYSKRILGDATGEAGPFSGNTTPISSMYGDNSRFIFSDNISFYRGGVFDLGNRSGIFAFSRNNGKVNSSFGFRIILTPTHNEL